MIALTLVALASLVLGMGPPVTAAYIVLATLSAPALYNLIADAQLVDLIAGRSGAARRRRRDAAGGTGQAGLGLGHSMSTDEARGIVEALRTIDPSLVTGL